MKRFILTVIVLLCIVFAFAACKKSKNNVDLEKHKINRVNESEKPQKDDSNEVRDVPMGDGDEEAEQNNKDKKKNKSESASADTEEKAKTTDSPYKEGSKSEEKAKQSASESTGEGDNIATAESDD